MTFSTPLRTFRRCSTLDGHAEQVDFVRRGGHTVATLSPVWTDGGPSRETSSPWLDDPRFYINLNELETRTWRQILSGLSIKAIAETEGVSRTAIYHRIQGDRFGHGGMIGKNVWVLLWWRLRMRLLEGGRQ